MATAQATAPKRNPLKLIGFLLMGLIILSVGGLFAYVALLPDDIPKPFYLTLDPPGASSPADQQDESAEAGHETESAHDSESTANGESAGPVALPLPGEGLIFDTGTKIVNLSDPGGRRYLKVGIALEFAPHSAEFYTLEGEARVLAVEQFAEEMNSRRPVIDDLLITILSSRTFEQVYSIEGKETLRNELLAHVNELFPHEILMYVYFTEFVVQ